ncbi:hypothetical protein LEM8419_02648 [Neolewinella maritima]|uniref:AAA+ ATPase domain-containing protein n=1 Tax=Neolewinella maritima TaxID=1383882 RepID=A0ABM9B329_9BACT|nr:hypothetical protein [Neolewinella maritima]CAH1001742.1 hypothetical protein LEM8419_02648 [Neolewinella maritima]
MSTILPASLATTAASSIQRLTVDGPVEEMAQRTRELADTMITRGDTCPSGEEENPLDLDCRLLHFVWAERAKHFMMLYRDVQLQLQVASLLVAEGQSTPEEVDDLYARSRFALTEALEEWEHDHQTQLELLQRDERKRRKQLNAWKLQHNPWPVYRHQLNELAGQSEDLAEEYTSLQQEQQHFTQLRNLLEEAIEASQQVIDRAARRATEVTEYITTGDHDLERPGMVASKLDDYISEEATLPRLDRFTNAITTKTAQLGEQRVTVASDEGMLRYKEVNFRRATDQWVSAQAMPLLYELWELSAQVSNGLNVALVNVRNRALLLSNEIKAGHDVSFTNNSLAEPFRTFTEQIAARRRDYTTLRQRLEARIEQDLRLTSVYRAEAGFLPLPLQTGINVFTRRQGRLVNTVRNWLGEHVTGVNRLLGDAVREDRLSVSERTVRVIRQRSVSPDNAAYTNILMTKGYIGESFLVGRERETAHMAQLVDSWRQGYRGAVVLTGNRLAGKTLFGEMITNRYFAGQTIRLQPNAPLTVQGRRTKTSGNLREALAFVQKYTLQSRPLVWIDDLELWWDKDHGLAENVRALGEHIDDYSGRIFYLVATTNAVYRHLDRFMELDRVFQTEINLDDFALDDMRQAVLLRHGATHKQMVNAQGEAISEAAFGQLVRRIYRATDGNVGDTINRWAYFTERYDDTRVYQPVGRRYTLPGFLTPDTATILSTLVLEKRSRDFRLRRLFGPAYAERYGSILQRLIRVGVVTRNNDGSLELAERIANDVGRMLDAEDYLTYPN